MEKNIPSSSISAPILPDPKNSNGANTYAAKVRPQRSLSSVDISSLPEPSRRGDFPAVSLPEDLYDICLDEWKYSLIGRLDFKTPKFEDAKNSLLDVWTLKGQQYLRIREWMPNFNPENQRISSAMVWVRLPGLGMEFWKEEALLTIRKGLGSPVQVDEATIKQLYGFYASILIEIDFAKSIPEKLWIQGKSYGFWQKVEIPRPPKFCNHCKIVGHLVTECRAIRDVLQPTITEEKNEEQVKGKKRRILKGKQIEESERVEPSMPNIMEDDNQNSSEKSLTEKEITCEMSDKEDDRVLD
ncbi:protein of unknown function DUF4283 [Macleaya cordata]|uniref:Uncharacterized protein n=1 Tax=Macleaya cordata TaxID=56857 RepID=A0A200R2F5_MACCD|nr:protein of unknown function DUF4283 [Macleaya cordata]